jgi:hypothetical protein
LELIKKEAPLRGAFCLKKTLLFDRDRVLLYYRELAFVERPEDVIDIAIELTEL